MLKFPLGMKRDRHIGGQGRWRGSSSGLVTQCSPYPINGRQAAKADEELLMFRHTGRLQFESKPEKPDPVYAHKLQELIGGAFGEMTVTMQYMSR
jgi:hypothetical protein